MLLLIKQSHLKGKTGQLFFFVLPFWIAPFFDNDPYTLEHFSHQCFIPSFIEINLSERKIFDGFLPYNYGHGGHLGHVT